MKFAALPILALLGLSACQKDETISGQTTPSEVWRLTALNGQPVSAPVTLTFPAPGRIAGQAPCNSYTAPQTAPLPWFETGPIAATKRACPELPTETAYFTTLAQMTLIERQGNTLLISHEAGGSLEFRLD